MDAETQGAIDGAVEQLRRELGDLNMLLHRVRFGRGTPASRVKAPVGTLYLRLDGGAGTSLYVKESGTGDTGWIAK